MIIENDDNDNKEDQDDDSDNNEDNRMKNGFQQYHSYCRNYRNDFVDDDKNKQKFLQKS